MWECIKLHLANIKHACNVIVKLYACTTVDNRNLLCEDGAIQMQAATEASEHGNAGMVVSHA